jgi:hypothetical protein
MTLDADEFIRRFLIHVLPDGFHRIRHYGLFANGRRAENIARARQLLNVPAPQNALSDTDSTGDGKWPAGTNPEPAHGSSGDRLVRLRCSKEAARTLLHRPCY